MVDRRSCYSVASLVVCLGAAAAVAGQTSRQPNHILDVVTFKPTPSVAAPAESAGLLPGHVSSTTHRRPTVNLRARLVSLDLSSYETGDPAIYELELENAGRNAVVLPWSPDGVRVARESGGIALRQAILSLEVWDASGSTRWLAALEPISLVGSARVAASLQSLAPGEIALIRVPGVWRAVEDERRAILREPNGVVQVKGLITLVQEQVVVRTTNGLQVSIRDRLRR